ncbi:MAG: ATP-binding protein [Lachnospiraceae bacterium]|nr:ATP-binding protein [Lachnospiraceae bacterium]
MKRLDIEANVDKLNDVLEFLEEQLDENNCSPKAQVQLDVAVEEIFVNIAHYAYSNKEDGRAIIDIEFPKDDYVSITFYDNGVPYDPLAKEDPDITLSADDRPIGGLGIYMVKKSMDEVAYRHENGQNIFTIGKKIS